MISLNGSPRSSFALSSSRPIVRMGSVPSAACRVGWSFIRDMIARAGNGRYRRGSMEAILPVGRHATGRSGDRLIDWVVARRGEWGTVGVLLRGVVPEPVLAGLVALHDWMSGRGGMPARMLRWRRIA